MGSNKNKNKKDTKIIDTKLQTAWDLYNKAKSEVFDDSFPDPNNWIHNKEKLKDGWMKFVEKTNSEGILKLMMLNNTLGHYMQYMCDNF
jgi:hypothetical protein